MSTKTLAYITSADSKNVSIIDLHQDNQVVSPLAVGKTPYAIAIMPIPQSKPELDDLRADVSVTITDDPYPVKVGKPLTYTIKVTNHGPDSATGVTVQDTLKHVDIVSVESSQGRCREKSGVITCELGTLYQSEQAVVTIVVIPRYLGKMINFVIVEGMEEDYNLNNNVARQETIVIEPFSFQ